MREENWVWLTAVLAGSPRFLEGSHPQVRLLLEGRADQGLVFVPAVIEGELARKLRELIPNLQAGDELFIEGKLDWESRKDAGGIGYQLLVKVSRIQKVEILWADAHCDC